jgi:hypothetical protein
MHDQLTVLRDALAAVIADLEADGQYQAAVELDLAVRRIDLVLMFVEEVKGPTDATGTGADQNLSVGGDHAGGTSTGPDAGPASDLGTPPVVE